MNHTDIRTEPLVDVDVRYRHWVYRHPVAGAALAGVVATQIATIWGYYAKGIGLPSLPFPNYNGVLFAPASVAKNFSNFGNPGNFFVGQSIHFVNGVVFALLFALLAYKTLPTIGRKFTNVQKGIAFGIVQTIISVGFLFPYVYAPNSGFGILSFGANALGTNPEHWKLPFAVLLYHIVYGGLLGLLFDPRKPSDV
jgi:hypothetical protein